VPQELETILRLVAEGHLTPEEAAPVIEAMTRAERRATDEPAGTSRGRQLRIRVTERGGQVVNLRIPIGFVDTALRFVPGLGGDQAERIRQAVHSGARGPILDVEDPDGQGGVLISID